MKLRRSTLFVPALWLLLVAGCGGGGASSGALADAPDVADVAGGDTAGAEADASACGAPRERLATQSSAIVAGSATWDANLLPLTPAQALAVGGLLVTSSRWGTEIACTATLVAPTIVLTAAHCIVSSPHSQYQAGELQFAVGADLATPRHVFGVSAVHVHPSYDYWASDASHDVAVLVLATDALTTLGAEIAPVPVNCEALTAAGLVGEQIQVVGYGATDKHGEVYGTAKAWAVETIAGLSSVDITVDGGGQQGVCYGDSGGPAMFVRAGAIEVLGVLSWGDELCGYEDHFVRTDHECAFIAPLLPACGAVTELGACEGNVATSCVDAAVVRDDCAARGEVCALDPSGASRCAVAPDPCGGETLAGRCDAGAAVYCATGSVVRDDCAARGETCGPDAIGASRCVAPDPCSGETLAGRCQGADAIWCEAGEVHVRRCGDCQQACGWREALGGYDCVAP